MEPGTVVIVYGPTQSGKSTLVATLANNPGVAVGDGDGHSVTSDAALYTATRLGCPILDTPGINDTRLRFTNQQAGTKVALGVAAANPQRMKFIVVDSLANDSMQLKNTLKAFLLSFGREVLESVLVLATKADLRSGAARKRRVDSMRAAAEQQGIGQVLTWQSEGLSDEQLQDELEGLIRALAQLPGSTTQQLEGLNARVKRRAEELRATSEFQTQIIEVPEEYQEGYETSEEFEEPCVIYTDQQKPKTVQVPYQDTVKQQIPETYVDKGDAFGKVITLGLGFKDKERTRYRTIETPVTLWKEETRMVTESVPEESTRTSTRTVTKYRTRTRQVSKSVQYQFDLEHFLPIAMEEVVAEIRRDLGAGEVGPEVGAESESEWEPVLTS